MGLKTDSKSIKSDQRSLAGFKSKISAVFSHFDFPIILLAATGRDKYRKPRTGMWEELLEDADLDVNDGPDLQASFFVGDAGGRPATSQIKADHSCSDRDFAANVGIAFKTPEEYFLNEEARAYIRTFDPQTFFKDVAGSAESVSAPFTRTNPLDIVILCGSPGAGKSTFYWTVLEPLGYERVNQDILKTVRSYPLCNVMQRYRVDPYSQLHDVFKDTHQMHENLMKLVTIPHSSHVHSRSLSSLSCSRRV